VKTYGQNFQYQDFAPFFNAQLWDPDQWAELFYRSGAQYIVPTSKHHEGFCLWPSDVSWNWNSVDVGPQRDVLEELFTAVRNKGLHASLYFSLYEWYNPLYIGPDPHSYVDQVMLPQLYDIMNTYKPDLIFTDGEWEQTSAFWNSTEFLAWLFNSSPVKNTIVINDRWGSDTRGTHGGYYTAEYGEEVWLDHVWELNRGVDVFSFGWNRNSQAGNYTSTAELIYLLVRSVSYGGNFLLDVGPSWDGEIPVVMQERLLDIGQWLSVCGEAIYKTRKWYVQGEHNTTFYTQNLNTEAVYAITTIWPDDNVLHFSFPVPTSTTKVTLLGYSNPLQYKFNASSGLTVMLPFLNINHMPSINAWAIKMTDLETAPSSIPLQQYWSDSRTDNALCGTEDCANGLGETNGGYYRVRVEGLAFEDQLNETVPLTMYWSSANSDYATVANYNMNETGYTFVGINGYIFTKPFTGGIPLDLWWSESRKDFYTVGSEASTQDAIQSGYKYVERIGYSLPGPSYIYDGPGKGKNSINGCPKRPKDRSQTQ